MQRHAFVRGLGMAALGAAAVPEFVARASSQVRERVAIVGAGIAGLTAAMRLRDAGIPSTVFESSARVGGRMHSERSYWDAGQHTEWCGAMVDSTHVTIHSLARRFGLGLLDTYAGRPPRARDTCYLDATYYSMTDADRDFAKIWPVLQEQLSRVNPNTTYANATPTARRLDLMSMRDWIDRFVPGGLRSQLGRLINQSYRNEYGRETSELSALNLVMQLGQQRWYDRNHRMNVLGYSDQRYILANGSQALPEAIAASLPAGSIRFERRLLAIRRDAGGTYQLRFDHRGSREVVYADRVVLTMPFIVLRAVDYSGAHFDSAKIDAIENLGYGYHTKLHLQFDGRAWLRPQHPWPEPTTGQLDHAPGAERARLFARAARTAGAPRSLYGRRSGDARHAGDAVRADRRFAGCRPARSRFLRAARPNLARGFSIVERQGHIRQRASRSEHSSKLFLLARRPMHDDRRPRGAGTRARSLRGRAHVGWVSGIYGRRCRVWSARRRRNSGRLRHTRKGRRLKAPCTLSARPATSITANRR